MNEASKMKMPLWSKICGVIVILLLLLGVVIVFHANSIFQPTGEPAGAEMTEELKLDMVPTMTLELEDYVGELNESGIIK